MQEKINEKLISLGFTVSEVNMEELSEDEFQKIRVNSFGASDSSKLLDLNPFPNGTFDNLVEEKINETFDDTIGKKPSVRMGKDLEEFIIRKLEKILKIPINKSNKMYTDPRTGLSVNFDGIIVFNNILVPAEIKVVTKWGRRYYNWDLSENVEADGFELNLNNLIDAPDVYPTNLELDRSDIQNLAIYHATLVGIPIYYYTQLQQQLYFLNAPFGFLFVLDVDNWQLNVFKSTRNDLVIDEIKTKSIEAYTKVKLAKNLKPLQIDDDFEI